MSAVAYAARSRVVAVGLSGTTMVSDTGGADFRAIGSRLPTSYDRLRVNSDAVAFVAGSIGQFARTIDFGSMWAPVYVPTSYRVIDVAFRSGRGFALDSSGTLWGTRDGGKRWQVLLSSPDRPPTAVVVTAPGAVLLAGPRGIRRSFDDGRTFEPLRAPAISGRLINDLSYIFPTVVASGPRTVAVSSQFGDGWRGLPLPRGTVDEVSFRHPRIGYLLQESGRLFATRTAGRRWREIVSLGFDPGGDIAFEDRRRGWIDLNVGQLENGALLRTEDGGRSWQPQLVADAPFQDLAATESTGFATSQGAIFAALRGGRRGARSRLRIDVSRRRLPRAHRLQVTGTLRPASGGEEVFVSVGRRGRWRNRAAEVDTRGSFTTVVRVRRTSNVVAQWLGDGTRQGDGTHAMRVRVGGRP